MNDELKLALQSLSFWSDLNEKEKNVLLENAYIEKFSKGNQISYTEEECKGPIVILKGQIRTYLISEEGREVTVYRLHKGDFCVLSASCILDSIGFDVNIEAIEKTEILVIPPVVFKALQKKNPRLEIFLLETVNERFSDVMWTMQQILFMGVDKRVAIYLWDEFSKNGKSEIHITHDELARYIGSAREVVTRILNHFTEEGIVSLSRGKITIEDKEKLKTMYVT